MKNITKYLISTFTNIKEFKLYFLLLLIINICILINLLVQFYFEIKVYKNEHKTIEYVNNVTLLSNCITEYITFRRTALLNEDKEKSLILRYKISNQVDKLDSFYNYLLDTSPKLINLWDEIKYTWFDLDNLSFNDDPLTFFQEYSKLSTQIFLFVREINDLNVQYKEQSQNHFKLFKFIFAAFVLIQAVIALKLQKKINYNRKKSQRQLLLTGLINKVVKSTTDYTDSFSKLCIALADLLKSSRVLLIKYSKVEGKIILKLLKEHTDGQPFSIYGVRFEKEKVEKLFLNKNVLDIDDIENSDLAWPFKKIFLKNGDKSFIAAKIKGINKEWGFIVFSQSDLRKWTKDEKILVEEIAENLFLSIKQIETINILQKRSEMKLLLHKVSNILTKNDDLNLILDNICEEISNTLQVNEARIVQFFDKEGKESWNYNLNGNKPIDNYKLAERIDFWHKKLKEINAFVGIDDLDHFFGADTDTIDYYKQKQFNYIGVYPVTTTDRQLVGGLFLLNDKNRYLIQDEIDSLNNISQQILIKVFEDRMLNRLEERENYTTSILQGIKEGIITLTNNNCIESFNSRVSDIFGYDETDLTNNSIELLIPDFKNLYRKTIKEAEALTDSIGKIQSVELDAITQTGTKFPVEVYLTNIIYDDETKTIVVIRDISERKKVDTLKDEFIATISHELRTPITAIHGSLKLLLSGIVGEIPDKYTKMIEIAENNSVRLLNLVNDILDLEKIKQNKMEFNMEISEVIPLVKNSIDMNRPYGKQFQVEYMLKSNINLQGYKIKVDRSRFMQIFSNLLSNAAKFTLSGDVVEIIIDKDDDNIKFFVIDHGRGIPEESQKKLFRKFNQVDASSSRKRGGSGLGLSITKAIIEKMGGEIGFTSEEGAGTSFYFTLPEYVEKEEKTKEEKTVETINE